MEGWCVDLRQIAWATFRTFVARMVLFRILSFIPILGVLPEITSPASRRWGVHPDDPEDLRA
jgi:hypothetical protein